MGTQWKPGDVAMRSSRVGSTAPALRVSECAALNVEHWHVTDGGCTNGPYGPSVSYTPLVLIDPEKLADGLPTWTLSSLLEACAEIVRDSEPDRPLREETMLRTLADAFDIPRPKPLEPAGLGAVVEDSADEVWILVYQEETPNLWAKVGQVSVLKNWRAYADIDAVKVLAQGVTQ